MKGERQVKAQPAEVLKARLVSNKYEPDATLLNFHQPLISINSGKLSGLFYFFRFLFLVFFTALKLYPKI